ncbi:hypothetical protein OIO90_000885 [Microbotryomycetes sp. JL221]|nr:hypothetical protein OIO90_000885 [Microbotryomycetes sp. JL221]
MLHPALSTSLSKSFGLNSPFSLSALSSSLTQLSSSPGFSNMGMSLGRSFEDRPKLEAQFFRNFTCCGLDLQDLHGLLEHFEECHVAPDADGSMTGGLGGGMEMDTTGSDGTISGPPSPRMSQHGMPGQSRNVFEAKKSGLSSFDTPESPAINNIQLDPSMELDMEMDDAPPPQVYDQMPASTTATASTLAAATTTNVPATGFQHPSNLSAFENSLGLQAGGSASKKKFSTAMNATPIGQGLRGIGGAPLVVDPFAANRNAAATGYSTPDSSVPGTPIMEEIPGHGVEGLFSVNPSQNSIQGGQMAPQDASLGLAPSLLFPSTPADSPESDVGSPTSGREPSPSASSVSSAANYNSLGQAMHHGGPPLSALPSNMKEEQAIALAAALGQSSVAALPTATDPLGRGIQISPSGRPYTPPSEKPFKCSVPGCDKAYKQQNGLKYHRLHGHCSAGKPGQPTPEEISKIEGKPYVCHVATCGKRYKNMNGLRYHYQHSGSHGALGIQMLNAGVHPPPQYPAGHKKFQQQSPGW